MAPPIIEPVWCVTRLKRSTSTSCRCPATAPTSCRSRRSGAGSARMSPIITVIPPPRISAGEWPLSRSASIRTPAPSPIASGSKITSTLTKKNYASQTRRGLDQYGYNYATIFPDLDGISRHLNWIASQRELANKLVKEEKELAEIHAEEGITD